ncbi:Importin subunit alpha-4 [Tulasnella sp. 408]|nr:Importin subunit alpha-4 [Tulasnella sp. 408]
MSTTTGDHVVPSISQDHSTENKPAQSKDGNVVFDESVLESYITEDTQIAPDIVDALRSNDQTARLGAATKLHRLVEKGETTSAQAIINSGIIPDIVAMISLDDAELQVPLGFVLAFLTAGSSQNVSAVVEAGAIAKFIHIASSSPSGRARNYALRSLGNLGACSQLLSDRVIQEGGLRLPLDILGNPSKQKDSHNYWAADAVAGISHQLSPDVTGYELHIRDITTTLAKYIEYQRDETAGSLEACLLALSYISSNASAIDTVLASGIIPRVVQLCSSKRASARHSALRCVGYILYSNKGTKQLIKAGVLEALRPCIGSDDAQDRRLACWAASSIATNTLDQGKALIKAGFIPVLINVISNSEESTETRVDAVWALAGLTCNWRHYHQDVRETLLEENCLEGFLSALKLKDHSAVAISMKGIFRFVKTRWPGRPKAIERIEAAGGVATLRAFKLRPEANLELERYMAHIILKKHLKQVSLPPRV